MYRVIDVKGIFRILKNHCFNNQDCVLSINLKDSFLPQSKSSVAVRFENGLPHMESGGKCDVEVSMDIADFSSLIMGAVEFRSLYEYGLAEISDEGCLDIVDKIFRVEQKPICHTVF